MKKGIHPESKPATISNSESITLDFNDFSFSSVGIYASYSKDVTVSNSLITNNAVSGINYISSEGLIEKNFITENQDVFVTHNRAVKLTRSNEH